MENPGRSQELTPAVILLKPNACKGLGLGVCSRQSSLPRHTGHRRKMHPAALSTPDVENSPSRPSAPRPLRKSWSSPLLPPQTQGPLGRPSHAQVFRMERGCPGRQPVPLPGQRLPAPHSWNFPAHSFSLSDISSGKLYPYLTPKETSSWARIVSDQLSAVTDLG